VLGFWPDVYGGPTRRRLTTLGPAMPNGPAAEGTNGTVLSPIPSVACTCQANDL
jgi:hypothetical protein